MTTETTAAPPQGQPAEPASATQAEETKPAGLEEQAEQPQQTEADEPPKQPKGVQKRLDELTRRARDAERRHDEAMQLIRAVVLNKGDLPKVAAESAGPPKQEDFQTTEDYRRAEARWMVQEEIKAIREEAERSKQIEAVKQREATWEQRQAKASEKYEDFAEVALADDLSISPVMAEAMKDSDMGPDVAYYLGKNPAEAERIAKLSPAAQVREIGKIEARLEVKASEPAKRPSKAPAPIEPVGGGSPSSTDVSKMSMAEYEAYRAKQGAWWAKK